MRIDKIAFVDSFYTVTKGVNQYLYIYDPVNLQRWFAIQEQAYTGKQLAAAIQVATSFTTSYFEPRNEIRVTLPEALTTVMTDEQLATPESRSELARGRWSAQAHEH